VFVARTELQKNKTKSIYMRFVDFRRKFYKEHTEDALAYSGDEGRGLAAISVGEVPNNL
jgi:hypothetical protein